MGGMTDVVDDAPVGKEQRPVGIRGRDGVVGDHDDGLAELVDRPAQEAEHLGGTHGVQIAGGLVGEDDLGSAHEGARTGDALLLPT